jgi:hypothetical protein
MQGYEIVVLSLALSFTFVEVIKPFKFKPFNCIKCMSGWFGLAIGVYNYSCYGIGYIFICLFFGAIFEAIKMRYL